MGQTEHGTGVPSHSGRTAKHARPGPIREFPMTDLAQAAVPVPASSSTDDAQHVEQDLVDQDLLVEEVSIDGMCGVY